MAESAVKIKIKGDNSDFKKKMNETGEVAEKSMGKMAAISGAVGGAVASMATTAINYLSGLSDEAIAASDALQKFGSTMEFAGFDTDEIDTARKAVKQYADDTVFNLEDVANTTAQLAANGVKDYTELTEATGNLTAVAGGGADAFKSVAMMLTQTNAAGKLTTENWNQLADAIPGASGKLQEAMLKNGAYTGQFRDAMAKGEITAEEFNQALMDLGMSDAAVEAAKSTATIEGAVGNLEATVVSGIMNIIDAIGKDKLTAAIGFLGDTLNFIFTIIAALVGFISDHIEVFGFLAAAIGLVVGAQWAMTAAQTALNAVMSANPISLVIIAVVALVSALLLLYDKSEKFREFVNEVFAEVKEIALDLWESIKSILVAAAPLIDATWGLIKTIFAVALDFIIWLFGNAWTVIKAVWDFVQPYFEALMEGIRIAVEILSKVLPQLFEDAWKAIKFIWDLAGPYFKQVWNTIKTIFSVVKAVLSGNFGDAWKAIKNWWNESKAYFTQIWENIKAVFANVVGFFEDKFKEAYNKVTGWWDDAISFFSDIWEGVKEVFYDVVSFFGDKFEEAYNTVKEWFTVEHFKSIFKDSICGGLEGIIEDVKTAAGNVWTAIKEAMSKAISVVFGFGGGGDGGDDYGQGMTGSLSPFNVARVSSNYGWRINPVTKKRQFHSGVDLAAAGGTPIQSTTPGTVYRVAYEKNGFGNYVVVQDRNGNLHYYAHMSRTAARVGQPVFRGTRIGYVGTTGRSTGNHLHYGVKAGGNWTNPWAWLRGARGYATGGFPLPGELFFANENGIEMMGKMGKRNVVANNMQIIDGIRSGIYSGMLKLQNQNGGRTNNNHVNLTQNFYKENTSPSDTKRAARRGVREALAGGRA